MTFADRHNATAIHWMARAFTCEPLQFMHIRDSWSWRGGKHDWLAFLQTANPRGVAIWGTRQEIISDLYMLSWAFKFCVWNSFTRSWNGTWESELGRGSKCRSPGSEGTFNRFTIKCVPEECCKGDKSSIEWNTFGWWWGFTSSHPSPTRAHKNGWRVLWSLSSV